MSVRSAARLALLRGLGRALPRSGRRLPFNGRILVLRPDHIGDLLFLTPALQELRASLPDARIVLAVGPWVASLAHLIPDIDGVEVVPFPGFTRRSKPNVAQPYLEALRLARRWRGRFDACLVAREDHWWGAMVAALAGIPHRIGWRTPETEPFLTSLRVEDSPRHEVVANIALGRTLLTQAGAPPPRTAPDPDSHPVLLRLPPEVQDRAHGWLQRNLGTDSQFLGVHPGAGTPNKLWPLARYQTLTRSLSRRLGLPVVITGSLEELELVEQLAATCSNAVPAAGEFSLPELAAVLGRAALVAGSDSGPLHLAAAGGAPTVHIYGPADERRFGPWTAPARHRVLVADVPCRPCNDLWHCSQHQRPACMREVSAESVVEAACSLLSDTGPPL